MTDHVKTAPSVSIQYAATGASKKSNELGMRAMQERAYQKRGEQHLLIKSPPASGKSYPLKVPIVSMTGTLPAAPRISPSPTSCTLPRPFLSSTTHRRCPATTAPTMAATTILSPIYIGRRFRNDAERLEKLFDTYTEMTAKKEKAS